MRGCFKGGKCLIVFLEIGESRMGRDRHWIVIRRADDAFLDRP